MQKRVGSGAQHKRDQALVRREAPATSAGDKAAEGETPEAAAEAWFAADERRGKALELVLRGASKAQIARELGDVHRNTINNWTADSRFVLVASQRHREHVASTRQRRLMQTNEISDKVAYLVRRAVDRLVNEEQRYERDLAMNPSAPAPKVNGDQMRYFRELSFELRAFRQEERKDVGDDVHRVDVRGSHQHTLTGDIHVAHKMTDATPFATFLRRTVQAGAIDPSTLPDPEKNAGAFLLGAARQAFARTDILDVLDAEDAELVEDE